MTRDEIEFLRSLDKDGVDGTIQAMILDPNITKAPFNSVARILLTQLVKEKHHLVKDNINLSKKVV